MKKQSAISGQRSAGFTLIELLTVIAIIMVLAGLTSGIGRYALNKAKTSRAQTEIATLEMALSNFQVDRGFFPTGDGIPKSSTNMYFSLIGGKKKYLTLRPNQVQSNSPSEVLILDPFGQPYRYWYKGFSTTIALNTNNPTGFDLWSAGRDGKDFTADDINNWSQ